MLERTDMRTLTVMRCVAFIMVFTLTCGVSCTSDIPGGSGDSVKEVQGVPSNSQSTMPISVVLPATAVPSIGRIRDFFQNHAKNGPQISNLVTRVKQPYIRPRVQWRRTQRNSAIAGQRMMGVLSTGRLRQMRNHHRNPYSPNPRSRIGYRNPRLARDDQHSASASQGRSPGDIGGASPDQSRPASNAGNNEQVSVRINAMKNPRINNRRWVRLRPYQPQYLYPMVYPRRWIPANQNSQARRNPSSETAEAVAMLTQRLSRMEASMARLKEAIVLQGAAHLQSAEKLQAMMEAQAEVNTRNGRDTRDILLTVKRCCACSAQRGEALRRNNVPSAAMNSMRSPHQYKRDFVPPLIHMKRNNHGHHSIGVKYSSSRDPLGAQDPDGKDNNDLGRQTTEPGMNRDNLEQTSIGNGDGQTPQFVKTSTPKFKLYAVMNVTDADNNITEVIRELSEQKPGANGNDIQPEHTMKEEMVTTGTPDTATPTVSSGGIYGYAAAYRRNNDQLLMHSSGSIPLRSTNIHTLRTEDEANAETTERYRNDRQENSTTSDIGNKLKENISDEDDSNSIYNKDVEPTFLHTSTPTLQTSEETTETTSTSVQQEMITDAAKTLSEFTSVTATTITPEATPKPDEPDKSSSHPEETTLQSVLRTLSYLRTEDEKGAKSLANPKSSPQSLARNVDVLDTTKKTESEDKAEDQHHITGSEATKATKEEHLPEATTEKQSLDEAEDAATADVLGKLSTSGSTRPLKRQSEPQQMTTVSAPKEVASKPKEEAGPLQVDFSSGDIQNDGMPGVTWIVRPSAPGSRQGRRRLRRSTPRRSSWERSRPPQLSALSDCSLQGVLKFSFTPPALKSPTASSRHRHHRRGEEEEEEAGGGDGDGGRRRKLMLNLEVWRPSRWVFNLGDSAANNGFSGDGSIQENDCEAQGYGQSFAIYASDKHPDGRKKLLRVHNGFLIDNVTLIISDQTLQWNNHHGNQGTLTHASLFALSGQSDNQGSVNYDVYLGLNRVIDGSYRSGHGLCRLSAQWLPD